MLCSFGSEVNLPIRLSPEYSFVTSKTSSPTHPSVPGLYPTSFRVVPLGECKTFPRCKSRGANAPSAETHIIIEATCVEVWEATDVGVAPIGFSGIRAAVETQVGKGNIRAGAPPGVRGAGAALGNDGIMKN